jgi:prolyl-tRNA synthetase
MVSMPQVKKEKPVPKPKPKVEKPAPAAKHDIENPEALTAKKSEFSDWYHQVIKVADVIDQRYPFQGFLTYKPYGYAIFDRYIKLLEEKLAMTGHHKVYFPAIIPERLLKREESHIQGFGGEVFWVLQAGERKLNEPAALRPTSETVMYEMLRLWIRSWRDLPLKIHQSTSVWRYETKHTRPLIRDREILWNETHTSHATAHEAAEQIKVGKKIYSEIYEAACIPVVWLNVVDVFAGAESALEPYAVFPDGRGLEMGSVNNLGQRFSKAFGVKFKDAEGKEEFCYQTCYGISERVIAAAIAINGDDKGLVMPPALAPYQAVIVPIVTKDQKEKVLEKARNLKQKLEAKFRVHLDERELSPGAKFYDWELRGVPVRIEIGPKDIERKTVVVVRRDTGEKVNEIEAKVNSRLKETLEKMQKEIYARAVAQHNSKIADAGGRDDIKKAVDSGRFARVLWCGDAKCAEITEKAADAHFLGYAVDESASGKCVCGQPAKHVGYVGKTY